MCDRPVMFSAQIHWAPNLISVWPCPKRTLQDYLDPEPFFAEPGFVAEPCLVAEPCFVADPSLVADPFVAEPLVPDPSEAALTAANSSSDLARFLKSP